MPITSCTEFSQRLAEAVERRESADLAVLREHASTCAECRSAWLDALLVERAVAQWKKPVASAGLTERILLHVAAETVPGGLVGAEIQPATTGGSAPTSRPQRRTRTAGLVLTALALCACVIVLLSRSPKQPNVVQRPQPVAVAQPQQLKVAQRPTEQRTSSPANDAPVELLVADAGSAYLHLASDAAKAVTAASLLVPPADVANEPAHGPDGRDRWVDDVRREIAPVTHQLSHAFEFLIQAVPAKRAPAT
jgi:hypothetical protein